MAVELRDNKITLVIDVAEFEDYKRKVKHKNPNKKMKLKSHMWTSINVWANQNRYVKNDIKQSYHEFILYFITKYNLQNLNLSKVELKCTFFFKTKHRKDISNYVPKNCEDGLVESGFLEDDNHTVLNPLTLMFGGYDKDNERVEMEFTILKEDELNKVKKILK